MTLMLAALLGAAHAAPITLHHQARLLDAAGAPVHGSHDLTVALWDAAEGNTTPLWQARFDDSAVEDGFVSLALGTDGSLDSSTFLTGAVWVSIAVDDAALGERLPLASVPSAGVAHSVLLGMVDGCDADRAGALRYTERGEFEGCNGAAWIPLGAQPGSEVFPGATCKDILSRRPTAVDGVYFANAGTTEEAEPIFCDMASGGWTLIGKASNGSAGQFGPTFLAGNSHRGEPGYLDRSVESASYASRFAGAWWGAAGFTEVRLELWRAGALVKALEFDATGATNSSWFDMPRLTEVTGWTDLPNGTYNAFSISSGDANYRRDFYISHNHGGCPADAGWLAVTWGTSCTEWHNPAANRILYSPGSTYMDWSAGSSLSESTAFADVMVILAR